MDESKVSFKEQFIASTICTTVFALVYNLAGFYANSLKDVSSILFPIDSFIPFISISILPYSTSIMFFFLVFYITKSKDELILLTKRMLFITIISGFCFIVFPLKNSYTKPKVDSTFLNLFFDAINKWDNNFNQAPSLHVSYACIYWSVLKDKVEGLIKWLVATWIFLIGASTLAVYQHHTVDVITALMLICITFYIFPTINKRNCRISMVYFFFSLCILLFILSNFTKSYIVYLVGTWIMICCNIVGYAYLYEKKSFLKNKDGKLEPIMKILCLPYVLMYQGIRRFARSSSKPIVSEVYPQLYIGGILNNKSLDLINISKKTIVIDLCAELAENTEIRNKTEYYSFPLLDIATINKNDISIIVDFISKKYLTLEKDSVIYLHCTMGYSRSVYIATVFIQHQLSITTEEAISYIKNKIPHCVFPYYLNRK